MNLSQYSRDNNIPELNVYAETGIWFRSIDLIKQGQWQLIYARLCRTLGLSKANHIMEDLKGSCLTSYLMGEMQGCDLLNFTVSPPPLDVDHIVSVLNSFQHNEKCLITFAAAEDMTLKEAILLKWQDAKRRSFSALGKSILDNTIRHFKFDYCFWEYGKYNRPLPLVGFETRFALDSNMQWDEFKRRLANTYIPSQEEKSFIMNLLNNSSK